MKTDRQGTSAAMPRIGGPLGRLMIVDDEPELLAALQIMIADEGYEISGFTAGDKALAALRETDFDILLTDLMMPGMNGLELMQAAAEIDPHIVGIVMTGHATVQTAIEALKAGVFDYVLKPFKVRNLLPVLGRALAVRRLRLENLQLKQTVAIYELGQTISYTLALNTILDKVADGALQQCEADESSIMLPTADGRELYIAAIRGKGREGLLGRRVPKEGHIAGWVVDRREPVMLKGIVKDPRFAPALPRSAIELSVSLPLLAGGRLEGVLCLNFTRPRRPLSLGELKALSILSSIAATALESARLYGELEAAELKYRDIFQNAPEGIFQIDAGGERLLTANRALAGILGDETSEALIKRIGSLERDVFVRPEDFHEITRRLMVEGSVSAFECEWRRLDAAIVWVSLSCRKVPGAEHRILHEGTVEDVTRQRAAEDKLKKERNLLHTVIDNLPDVIYIKDVASRFLLGNAALLRLLGTQRLDGIVGKSDHDFFPLEMADAFLSDEKELFRTGVPLINREEVWRGADGMEKWALTSKIPLRDESGSVTGLVGIGRDITELKHAIEEIESLSRFPEENPNPVMRVSADGTVLYANSASKPLTDAAGFKNGERIPQEWFSLIMEDAAAGSRKEIETERGGRIWSMTVTPVPDARYTNIYALDVTENRKLEGQLRQSQKMEAIGNLAGGVAHDFNNILTAIIGYSDYLLIKLGETNPLRREIGEIKKAGHRAASLTQQLLAFSRKQIRKVEVLDLNAVIAGLEKMLHRLISENISIVTSPGPGLGRIRADEGQVEQVILNLVLNARDAMPDGGTITIETADVDLDEGYVSSHFSVKPGPYAMLCVSDTGIGMDAETKSHLFEPFFTTKESGKGTGLGLSTVYGIVKQNEGNIWVYSEPGKGSTFKVYLPRNCGDVVPAARRQIPSEVATGTETILAIDDEEMIRNILKILLEEGGYTVLLAKDGEEADKICAAHAGEIHLLLTDVVLPKMNGREVARHLTARRPQLRVLYMSGYTANAIAHHGVLDSDVAFLPKPFEPTALLRKIREVLDAGKKDTGT